MQNRMLKGSNASQNLEKKKTPKKRPLSSSSLQPPEDRISPQKQPSSSPRKPREPQKRPNLAKWRAAQRGKHSAVSSQSKEDVAENEGISQALQHQIYLLIRSLEQKQ